VNRTEKAKLIETLRETLGNSTALVVTRQAGLTVAEVTELRRQVRSSKAGFKVIKNRITRLALKGTPHEGLAKLFVGPTAIAYSQDPVAAAKAVVEFANKNEKLTIIGGGLQGQALDPAGIKALAKLPSIDELRGMIVGLLQTPATRIARLLKEPAAQLARVVQAQAQKGGTA
jgi:large subunit ribosomal protein L10